MTCLIVLVLMKTLIKPSQKTKQTLTQQSGPFHPQPHKRVVAKKGHDKGSTSFDSFLEGTASCSVAYASDPLAEE